MNEEALELGVRYWTCSSSEIKYYGYGCSAASVLAEGMSEDCYLSIAASYDSRHRFHLAVRKEKGITSFFPCLHICIWFHSHTTPWEVIFWCSCWFVLWSEFGLISSVRLPMYYRRKWRRKVTVWIEAPGLSRSNCFYAWDYLIFLILRV